MDLLEVLDQRVVLADGAIGTLLHARGHGGGCLEELCVTRPDLIAGIHGEYIEAGAQVIRTHSFGSNAVRLAATGNERRVGELNWMAARIAREAVKGTGVQVAGCVGPTGDPSRPGLRSLFEDHIGSLLDGGANFVLLETFTDLQELLAAVEAKHSLHHCPVVASLAVSDPAQVAPAFKTLRDAGADIVGINCLDPAAALAALEGVDPAGPLSAFPSAGLPAATLDPTAFAAGARVLRDRGARLLGGCCGTTPAHIAALKEALV